jgi:AcrR family transcriptional regulator
MTAGSSSSPTKALPPSARERILAAAAEVFAREGLTAATTREIAAVGGVNEVTLFRLFHTKLNLFSAVLNRVFADAQPPPSNSLEAPASTTCLREIVHEYAGNYAARLGRNFLLIRVLIGEIRHFQEHELKIMRVIFYPERQRFLERLRTAQRECWMRRELDPVIITDQIEAIVFTGLLRSSLPSPPEYSTSTYLGACVEIIVRAIEDPWVAQPPASVSRFTPASS